MTARKFSAAGRKAVEAWYLSQGKHAALAAFRKSQEPAPPPRITDGPVAEEGTAYQGKARSRSMYRDSLAAEQFMRSLKIRTPCSRCGEVPRLRVGEKWPRLRIEFWPKDGSSRAVLSRMVFRGAEVERIQIQIAKCVALCQKCKPTKR